MDMKTKFDNGESKNVRIGTLEKTIAKPCNRHCRGGLAKCLRDHEEALTKLGELGQSAHLEKETQKRKLMQNMSSLGFT